MVLLIGSVLFALGVSFLCSILEATVLSVSPAQVAALSSRRPRVGAIWQDFKSRIDRPISVILMINTTAHTIGAAVAGAQFDAMFGSRYIFVFSLVFTYLMLQFTEILPKTLGVQFNREIAVFVARPMQLLVRALEPIVVLLRLINKPFERKSRRRHMPTLDEISALAGVARLSKLIGRQEERIITRASQLARTPARQVMIPVEDVTFLSTSMTLPQAIVAAHLDPHTRFPITDGDDRNRVVGYVNFKEMIYRTRTNPSDPSLLGIVRPVYFADPDDSAAELMRIFTAQHVHMAIVRDRDGRTLGLITLEDVVEELVGEIEDEFDRLPSYCHALQGGTWMVGGNYPVAELVRELNVQLPDTRDNEPIAAWLTRRLGAAPQLNQTHRQANLEFVIRRMRRGKIFEVSVRKVEAG